MTFSVADLFANGKHLDIQVLERKDRELILAVTSTSPTSYCPNCGQSSHQVHSHYTRHVRDLPFRQHTVHLQLTVRRFRCRNRHCSQSVFCERLPGFVNPHARMTQALTQAHCDVGLALGGEPGARLASRLAMPISGDTLLRRVKQSQPLPGSPRVVGVDDWALRKGQTYGTILVDLERGAVLDLLPGRNGESLKALLQEHPDIEVLTRDRWDAYAKAASEQAPQAQQVLDRWHLLKNLREMLERLFERYARHMKSVLASGSEIHSGCPSLRESPLEAALPNKGGKPLSPTTCSQDRHGRANQTQRAKQRRRQNQFEEVRKRYAEGSSIRQIARDLGLSRQTIRRYVRETKCPNWQLSRPRRTQLDRFQQHIEDRLQNGRPAIVELYRELKVLGSSASYDAVRRYVTRRLGKKANSTPRTVPTQKSKIPSPRQLSFEILRRPEKQTEEEKARRMVLRQGPEPWQMALRLAEEFIAMVRNDSQTTLSKWLTQVEQCGVSELQTFAKGLKQEKSAVQAALEEPWSNGPVEGQVNRLKQIKRSMYGRAGLELLRSRVCTERKEV